MNQDKAREYFSAYHEGALEPGLRQSFELCLKSDPTLQADFSAFVETMDELRVLSAEEVEIPVFLSDRIATRLEQEMAKRRRSTPVWSVWMRGLLFSGLGAAAIAGAILSLHSSGRTAVAGTFPSGEGDQPSFSYNRGEVVMSYHPSGERTVVIFSGVSGRELQRFTVDAASPSHSFENKLPGTALFEVQVLGDSASSFLALPGQGGAGTTRASGTASSSAPASAGTIRDFAVAIATRYHLPVVLRAADTAKRLSWKLAGLDADRAAATALAGEPYVVDQRENGILNIGDR